MCLDKEAFVIRVEIYVYLQNKEQWFLASRTRYLEKSEYTNPH
jgi:hypothetical protein